MSRPASRAVLLPDFMGGGRRHEIEQQDGTWRSCAGPGFCPVCNREAMEPYMSEETKAKIRAVLEEHLGPAAREIGDQASIKATEAHMAVVDWITVTIALETEFGVRLSMLVVRSADTVDLIARYVDMLFESRDASPH